jgi:hypothetical protein
LNVEVLDQQANIVTPRAEWWYLQDGPAQTIVEILPERPALDRGLEVSMRRGDEPHVHTPRLRGANRPDFATLEEAQEHHLRIERKVAHLVEEDGPAFGDGEEAGLPRDRAGERAALVAEEFAEEQVPVQRAGVDGLEAASPPAAEPPD